MIQIVAFKFQNAVTYQECLVPLEDQGLVFLTGPNGCGKSTIWEILEHVIYAKTSKGVRLNQIVMPHSDEGYIAQLVFKDGDKRWRITQARRHPKWKTGTYLHVKGKKSWIDKTPKKESGRNRPQLFVQKLFGLSQAEFHGCVYLSQQASHTLIEGTGGQCYKYLGDLFMLDSYDQLSEMAAAEAKERQQELVDVEKEIAVLDHVREELDGLPTKADLKRKLKSASDTVKKMGEHLDKLQKRLRTYATKKEKIRAKTELIEEAEEKGVNTAWSVKDVSGRLEEAKNRKKELVEERDEVVAEKSRAEERKRLRQQIKIQRESLPEKISLEKAKSELSALREEQTDLVEERQRAIRLHKGKRLLAELPEVEIETSEEEVKQKQQTYADANSNLKALRQKIKALASVGVTCPTCYRPYPGADKKAVIKEAKDEIRNLVDQIDELDEDLQETEKVLKISQRRKHIEDGIAELRKNTLDLSEIEEKDARLDEQISYYQKAQSTLIKLDILKTQLSELSRTEKIGVLTLQIEDLDGQITVMESSIEQYSTANMLLKRLAAYDGIDEDELPEIEEKEGATSWRIEKGEEKRQEALERRGELQMTLRRVSQLEEKKEVLEEREEAAAGLRREVLVCKTLRSAFGSLKARRVHEIAKTMESLLGQFTEVMFAGHGVTFRVEDKPESIAIFKEVVATDPVNKDKKAIDVPVQALSGGEKQRLSICLLWTLHQMVSSKKRVDMLVLDEVDKGLDPDGVEALISLIESKRQDIGTIVVISHRNELSRAAFDQTWTVKKDGEVSSLVVR